MEIFEKNLNGGGEANRECPECHSKRNWKAGVRQTLNGEVQRFLCRDCGFRFSEKSNIEFKMNRGRQLCAISEAKKLDTTTEIKTVAGEGKQTTKGQILQFEIYLDCQGSSVHTIKGFSQKLRQLARNANLNDSESVKKFLVVHKISKSSKQAYCVAYTAFLKWQGKTWEPPKYKCAQRIPEFIPTEKEIDAIVAGCGHKTATQIQTVKETGMRIGEVLSLTWQSLNAEARTLTLNTPEKNSLPRIFKISPKLIAMIQSMPKKSERIFGKVNSKTPIISLARQRQKLAKKLANPRIAKIHFHLIRHWVGTMEYHKTHDLVHVQRLLGQRSILNTMIYINLEQAIFEASDEYIVKRPKTTQEEDKLISVGFEYVRFDEKGNTPVYRKRA